MESEFRILRRADCLCAAECQHQPHICDARRRSAPTKFLLDTSSPHGHDSPAPHRQVVRPHLVPYGPSQTLSSGGRHRGRAGDGSPAQRRQPESLHIIHASRAQCRHVVRSVQSYFPRHQHQCGYAALQDDGRGHGKRGAEGQGLLHPEFPLQCRQPFRISFPHLLHLDRNRERSA